VLQISLFDASVRGHISRPAVSVPLSAKTPSLVRQPLSWRFLLCVEDRVGRRLRHRIRLERFGAGRWLMAKLLTTHDNDDENKDNANDYKGQQKDNATDNRDNANDNANDNKNSADDNARTMLMTTNDNKRTTLLTTGTTLRTTKDNINDKK